jgi:NADH-quinone oxidoreductase subunit J
MSFLQFSFYLFALIMLVAAIRVVTVRNSVKAALYLVLTFFSAACIWITLEAEFLAIVLVLVYVGAVMVLFLFVVMMLDIDSERLREGFFRLLPVGSIVAVVMIIELGMVMTSVRFSFALYRFRLCIRASSNFAIGSDCSCNSTDTPPSTKHALPVTSPTNASE